MNLLNPLTVSRTVSASRTLQKGGLSLESRYFTRHDRAYTD